jgi:asparagine synthase (glutamine-hydrolysing)
MCGIAGAVRGIGRPRLPPPAHGRARLRAIVSRMSEAQRHRGPDGTGDWESERQEVAFGHRRLAVIDLSAAAAQPMMDGSGCVLTYNGEIYNFAELRRDLEADGEEFRSSSDTEVILAAYRRWGLDAVARFRGIFAFALWDPEGRVVHLVRDPLGVKPLYWSVVREGDDEIVLFASEIRALLASGAVARRLDPSGVASFLWHGFVVGPATVVEGVHLLPAATILTLQAADDDGRRNHRRMCRYWEMPSSDVPPATSQDLRRELERTVRMQMVADVPVGVFLSGGVDSSAVAALAAPAAHGRLHTFTIGFEEATHDESGYAARVAQAIGSRHTAVVLTEQAFHQGLPAALDAIDQPTFDGINTYFVSRAAREAGMTVALAGTGGDELFGGYRSFEQIPRLLRAGGWLPRAGPGVRRRALEGGVGLAERVVSAASWRVLGMAPPQTRLGKLADVTRAASSVVDLYQVFYAAFTRESQAMLAGEAVRAAQARLDCGILPDVAGEWRRRTRDEDPRHAVSRLELSSYVGERLLRDTDAASMAVSLEVRVPLLDHVVAETAAGIDPGLRFSPPGRKQLLREAALSGIDPGIFERPKSGFVFPIDRWARAGLRPRMEAVLGDPLLARQAGLRGEAVGILWRSFDAGRPGLYWTRVWSLYVLLSWCQRHGLAMEAVEAAPPGPVFGGYRPAPRLGPRVRRVEGADCASGS